MYQVDEKPETIHLYIVREEEVRPSILPVVLSLFTLALLLVLGVATPYKQPEERLAIRLPAVFLAPNALTATEPIIPTGSKIFPATTAHGILTITNGSVISQTIPQGFIVDGVATDSAVFVPAGSANGYGIARVSAHAVVSGERGNISTYAINYVEGSSIYIRNLSPFTGGDDSYSVRVITQHDRQTAIDNARASLMQQEAHIRAILAEPCKESSSVVNSSLAVVSTLVKWTCQFIAYPNITIPSARITAITLLGKNLLVEVIVVAKPRRVWVK